MTSLGKQLKKLTDNSLRTSEKLQQLISSIEAQLKINAKEGRNSCCFHTSMKNQLYTADFVESVKDKVISHFKDEDVLCCYKNDYEDGPEFNLSW